MSGLSIKLEGFPEKVQRIADVLEDAFPGMMDWVLAPDASHGVTIKIEGYEVPAWADTVTAQTVVQLRKC